MPPYPLPFVFTDLHSGQIVIGDPSQLPNNTIPFQPTGNETQPNADNTGMGHHAVKLQGFQIWDKRIQGNQNGTAIPQAGQVVYLDTG